MLALLSNFIFGMIFLLCRFCFFKTGTAKREFPTVLVEPTKGDLVFIIGFLNDYNLQSDLVLPPIMPNYGYEK